MMNYHQLAFTDAVKELQELNGSRTSYARMEDRSSVDGMSAAERDFIEDKDSFYMASIGTNGFPYIQHRGGPKGFIKVLDERTLGIVDFSGNKQYITVGNAATNSKVALFIMDYPRKARLKLYAEIRIVELSENKALFDMIDPAEYKHKAERMMLFDIKAFDWNCPQHITPRYTLADIELAFEKRNAYVKDLEDEVERLRKFISDAGIEY